MLTNRMGKFSLNATSPPVALTATSIYPGRGGPLDSLFPRNPVSNQAPSDEEDFQMEDEDDWMGDLEQIPAKSTRKHPSKFSESVAAEVSNVCTTFLTLLLLSLETFLGGFQQCPGVLDIPRLALRQQSKG